MAAGSIVIDLLMKTGSFETDTKRAEKRLQALSKRASQVGSALGLALAGGALAAAAGITAMVQVQRNLIDDQAKLAQRLNTSYESLANLGRAGELAGVGMEQISTAGRQLDVAIGKAIQGSKLQADAFARLGISAQELAAVPLDKRMATINAALRDNVTAAERSAVAADIFGTKNAAAMQMLDAGTIAEAARQVEIFGLNLSDVDAAKVEMANDSMSTFGMLADGIGKQLTVELAPILKAIGDEFLRSAEEAGGLGKVVQDETRKAVRGLAFVLDAADGVRRLFEVAGRVIAMSMLKGKLAVLELASAVVNGPTQAMNELIGLMNVVPGVNMGPVGLPPGLVNASAAIKQQIQETTQAIREGVSDVSDTLMAPLSGEAMLRAYDDAQLAAKSAAAAAVAGRDAAKLTGKSFEDTEAAAKAAAAAAKAAAAAMQRLNEEGRRITESLHTPTEAYVAEIERLNLLLSAGALGQDTYTRAVVRAQDAFNDASPAIKAWREEQEKLTAMMNATPSAGLAKTRADMLLLADAYQKGTFGILGSTAAMERFAEVVQTRLGTLPDLVDDNKDKFGELQQAIEGWGRQSTDALLQFTLTGKMNFRSMIDSMLQDLARMVIYKNIMGPLFSAIGGKDGWLSSFLGGARASGGPVEAGKMYRVNEAGPELLQVAGQQYLMMSSQPGHVTPIAAGPAPVSAMGAGGGSVVVNIQNNGGGEVRTSERQQGGTRIIDVMIERAIGAVAGDIAAGGRVAGALQGVYGLNRGANTPRFAR